MTIKNWLVGAVGALALGSLSASVQAAPLGLGQDGYNAATRENSAVQDVVWVRRCWYHNGHRHCRRVWSYDDGYYYGPDYYYGPSFGFSFGGGRHHGGHHHGGHGHR